MLVSKRAVWISFSLYIDGKMWKVVWKEENEESAGWLAGLPGVRRQNGENIPKPTDSACAAQSA